MRAVGRQELAPLAQEQAARLLVEVVHDVLELLVPGSPAARGAPLPGGVRAGARWSWTVFMPRTGCTMVPPGPRVRARGVQGRVARKGLPIGCLQVYGASTMAGWPRFLAGALASL